MGQKLLNLLLLLSFQFGYLEWGKDQSMFLFQAEKEILGKAVTDLKNILHPFILIPLSGSILLIITFFQKVPSRKLSQIGLSCLSFLMLLILFIGLLSSNVKMILSAIPFVIVGILMIFKKKIAIREQL